MCRFVAQAKTQADIRHLAERIVAPLSVGVPPGGDYTSEALAVCRWVECNIRYVRDINNVEFVRWPRETLKTRAGDCDDMSVLIAALMESIGASCSFGLAGFDGTGSPSHVFCIVDTPYGGILLDPVANRETRKMLSEIKSFAVVNCEQGVVPDATTSAPFHGWSGWRS